MKIKNKLINFIIGLLTGLVITVNAQETKEVIQPLSKKAEKGYLYNIVKDEKGISHITYKMKGDKKSDNIFYEEYTFDKELKFLGNTDVAEKKEKHEDREITVYGASVGGGGFDVMSMKLKLFKAVKLQSWSPEQNKYFTQKYLSNETVKAKNDEGKVYNGYASYESSDEANDNLFNIVKIDSKDKNVADKYYTLLFNSSMELKTTPIDLDGSHTLVFCDQLMVYDAQENILSEDVVMIFAPNKGSADVSKYVYLQYDITGKLKNKVEFKSPSSALLITAAYKMGENVYFCGSSEKTKDSFKEVYTEYASILNPQFTAEGNNGCQYKWIKATAKEMDSFHLLKFTGNQLEFASTTPVAEFKNKFKTAPEDKGATAYKGKKFLIQKFTVAPSGDFLIAGQLTSTVHMGSTNIVKSYEDIVCVHFDKAGNLKAQYGVGKINNDKKSEIFEMAQNFYLSTDGKKMFWEILEVKGTKGYESFMDAYNGNPTFYALYFPRIGSIDLANSSLNAFKVMGDEKYFTKRNFPGVFDKNEKSITYFGHDDDFKKLWVGKVIID